MYRGKVTQVDSSGVWVTTADFGLLGPCQAVVANYAPGDMVLCVDVGEAASPELVVVGRLTAKGNATAGSTTDNAVARFDGTGGALQNSGVTIDDSGNIVQSGGGSSYHRILGTTASMYLDASASGSWSQVMYRTNGVNRWTIYKNEAVESGSAAGSDLVIGRYADNGSTYNEAVKITRSTGRVRIVAAGTAAGIELGSSGPTITVGTGAPPHSPPDGSIYLRTDGTATTTLYVRAGGAWSALS